MKVSPELSERIYITAMAHLSKKYKIFSLLIAVIILAGLNFWLFGSNFITQRSLISEELLVEYNQTLSQTADQASHVASRQSSKPQSQEQLEQAIYPLQRQTDQIIAHLRTADYPTDLDAQVEQTLELAEILSFTLNTYQLKPTSELSSAHMAQVFRQTAINATNLNETP